MIDSLIMAEAVKINPDAETVLGRDDLIEIQGTTRITAASLAGKMFFIFRRLMDTAKGDLATVFDLDVHDLTVTEQLKQVYLRNELLPIPILLEMTGSALPQVYINVQPDHFVDAASASRIEGDLSVLGTVSRLIPSGDDGYLSAEEWLLHDWEYMIAGLLRTAVQLLQVGAITASSRRDSAGLETAEERITEARAMLTKASVIRTSSSSTGSNTNKIDRECDAAQTSIDRLLSRALNALASVAIEVVDAGVFEPDSGSPADVA